MLLPPYAMWADFRDVTRWCSEQVPQPLTMVTVTGTSYTVGDEVCVFVDDDTAGGAVTVNLPPAGNNKGRFKHIKKLGTTGSVTIDGDGAETIDGAATLVITTQYTSYLIVSSGSGWYVV